uniref:IS110 family transposase n=1 Tax=Lonepinella sp. BR2271 TaxID=3434550 RepID=UPI003F6E0CE7
MSTIYCGIDVAKDTFVVAFTSGKSTTKYNNSASGIALFIQDLANKVQKENRTLGLTVLEATGGLESEIANALTLAQYRTTVINPYKAKKFGEAISSGKTDPKDAQRLAAYACMLDSQGESEV